MATTLSQKLQIKPGQRLAILNVPDGYETFLAENLPDAPVVSFDHDAEAALIFITALSDVLPLIQQGIQKVGPQGLLWLAYPKGTSGVKTDVNRDKMWAAALPSGWRPIRMVALDDTWSGMRFRPEN